MSLSSNVLSLITGLVVGLFVVSSPDSSLAANDSGPELVEGIAAQVGNQIVLASEVFEMSAPIEERMKKAGASAGNRDDAARCPRTLD